MIAAVAFTLCLMAAGPSAAAAEGYLATQPFVEQSTDLIADPATAFDATALVSVEKFEQLPESPGGVIAKVTTCTKLTDNAKEVLPGGAAGVASIGIRGPKLV